MCLHSTSGLVPHRASCKAEPILLALGFPGFPFGPMPFVHDHTCNHPRPQTPSTANGAPRQSRKRPSTARFVRENLCGTRPHASVSLSRSMAASVPDPRLAIPSVLWLGRRVPRLLTLPHPPTPMMRPLVTKLERHADADPEAHLESCRPVGPRLRQLGSYSLVIRRSYHPQHGPVQSQTWGS